MKEYTRRITGIIETYGRFCEVDGKSIEEMIAKAMGEGRKFAGTISLCVTDLTEDSGAEPSAPEQPPAAEPDPLADDPLPAVCPPEPEPDAPAAQTEEGSGAE